MGARVRRQLRGLVEARPWDASWLIGRSAPGAMSRDRRQRYGCFRRRVEGKQKGPLSRPLPIQQAASSGVAIDAGRLRRGRAVLRNIRVVQLVDGDRQVDV